MSSDITFVLSLDDQDFTVGLKNAEKLVKNFGNRVGGAGGASDQVDRLNLSIDNFAAKTRDLTVILATAQAAHADALQLYPRVAESHHGCCR